MTPIAILKTAAVSAIIWVAIVLQVHCATVSEIDPGAQFHSPDGRWIAECEGGGLVPSIDAVSITNATRTNRYLRIEVRSPLYFVGWTGDSETLVVVDHLAGGSVASVVHFECGTWKGRSADPRDGNKYRVIGVRVMQHTVRLTYVIMNLPTDSKSARFYRYSFLFDPRTTKHTDESTQAITADEYAHLRFE